MTAKNETIDLTGPNGPKAKASQKEPRIDSAGRKPIPPRKRVQRSGPLGHLNKYKRPGYITRLSNDIGKNIQNRLDDGWTFVQDKDEYKDAPTETTTPSRFGASVVREDVKNGIIAYLMEIPEEWYEHYQAEKQKDIDLSEQGLGDPITATAREANFTIETSVTHS